jgi:uroporphyrinogen-III synthase
MIAHTIALTRPQSDLIPSDESLSAYLEQRGHTVIDCALMQITQASQEDISQARQLLAKADAIVLVSPAAVHAALSHCRAQLQNKWIGVMGQGSATVLQSAAVMSQALVVSSSKDALGLLSPILAKLFKQKELEKRMKPPVTVIGRAAQGKNDLAQALQAHAIEVQYATLYQREPCSWPTQVPTQLMQAAKQSLSLLFTTASAPEDFLQRLNSEQAAVIVSRCRAVCTHPNVVKAARQAGFEQIICAFGPPSEWISALELRP